MDFHQCCGSDVMKIPGLFMNPSKFSQICVYKRDCTDLATETEFQLVRQFYEACKSLNKSCTWCNYSFSFRDCMEFHHVDETTKKFNIGSTNDIIKKCVEAKLWKSGQSILDLFDLILLEIQKCVSVCKACHVNHTSKQQNQQKNERMNMAMEDERYEKLRKLLSSPNITNKNKTKESLCKIHGDQIKKRKYASDLAEARGKCECNLEPPCNKKYRRDEYSTWAFSGISSREWSKKDSMGQLTGNYTLFDTQKSKIEEVANRSKLIHCNCHKEYCNYIRAKQ